MEGRLQEPSGTRREEPLDFRRVERAIRYLEENRGAQPELADVAGEVGLSKHHFHRLFRRWAGTTPKRFLEHLTVERARALLQESRSVLDAAFASGLSSGSRLHDHFVAVEAVTPGEVRARGRSLEIGVGEHPTPFGDAFLAATDRGICHLAFLPSGDDETRASARSAARRELEDRWPRARICSAPQRTEELVREVFDGVGKDGPLTHLHLKGTNFQLQVWRGLLRIPPGSVASYGHLAGLVGRPGAARAVAGAVAANPLAYLIPCHRVIRADGELGGYRWGASRKQAMLGRELVGPE